MKCYNIMSIIVKYAYFDYYDKRLIDLKKGKRHIAHRHYKTVSNFHLSVHDQVGVSHGFRLFC
jgi:hypothetical protein